MPPKSSTYDDTGIAYHTIPTFKFTNGTTLHDVKVAYRVYNPESTLGTILIPTCFSGLINSTLTFTSSSSLPPSSPSPALSQHKVVVAAMLGNGESASPSNKPLFPEPGELHYEDVIHAHYRMLTDGLGVESLEAVIGFSMGGQQAYHWAVMYPDFVKRIVGICTSARTTSHNYAFLEGPIAAMVNSLDYLAWRQVKEKVARGESVSQNFSEIVPKRGLVGFGRTYSAWLTSAEWFREKEWKRRLKFDSVEDWISNQGDGKLAWDADDLLVLARMWQMGDIGKTAKGEETMLGWNGDGDDGDLDSALSGIKCPVLLMPCRSDQYFRPGESEYEISKLKHGRLEVIESTWGHVAGGGLNPVDVAFMNEKIKDFLAKEHHSGSTSNL